MKKQLAAKLRRFYSVKQYWPELKVAEHEALARIELAMVKHGFECIRIDQNGFREDTGRAIRSSDAEFCLDLHFITPKVFPGISIGALWNPPDFYELFGLNQSLTNQMSHDMLVAANPSRARSWLNIVNPSFKSEILQLNHTVPDDFLAPATDGPKSYSYVGIGWDRTAGQGQRHRDLLEEIERSNPLVIYGPSRLGDNTRPWRNFKSYSGELPFDGSSVLNALNEAGMSLALSSASHLAAGISSNRLFETIAAGALPVVEVGLDSPFDISGAVFLDQSKSNKENAAYLNKELRELQLNVDEFKWRVVDLQNRMRNGFTLESQLGLIISSVERLRSEPVWVSEGKRISVADVAQFLNSYAGRQTDCEISADTVRELSKTNFNFYLKNQLVASNSDWLLFGTDVEFKVSLVDVLETNRHLSDFDVLHFETAVVGRTAGATRGLSPNRTAGEQRPVQSFAVKVGIVEDWLSQPSGMYAVASFLLLLDFDSKSEESAFKHGFVKSPNLSIREDQFFPISELITERDVLTLQAFDDFEEGSALWKLKRHFVQKYSFHAGPASGPPIDYKVILNSLAQMPMKEIFFYGSKAIGMFAKKALRPLLPRKR